MLTIVHFSSEDLPPRFKSKNNALYVLHPKIKRWVFMTRITTNKSRKAAEYAIKKEIYTTMKCKGCY